MTETCKMVEIKISRKTGKVTVKASDRVINPCYFTESDSNGNTWFGCYCPEEQSTEYIKKAFEQEISRLQDIIAKSQKTIAIYERKLQDYRL